LGQLKNKKPIKKFIKEKPKLSLERREGIKNKLLFLNRSINKIRIIDYF